jgi:steroid 5-alpha reductase family enzyme
VFGLFFVDTVGVDLGWSLGVVHISRSFSVLPVTQARIKGILILFISCVWFSLNHIQDPFGVLDEIF